MYGAKLSWLLLPLISLTWGRQCPPNQYLLHSSEISLTAVCYPSYYALLTWDNGDFLAENVRIHSSCSNSTTEVLQQLIDSNNQGDISSSTTVAAEQWDECDFWGCYVDSTTGRFFKLKKVSCIWPVTDFDECSYEIHSCSVNANCTDTSDSYNCTCHDGYEGDGYTCTNINECERDLSNCDVNAKCSDTNGSFICSCTSGYLGNGHNCTNIDECTLGTDSCHHDATCADTPGEFNCTCNSGFEGDGFNCTNIDECVTISHNCHKNSVCSDTVGGFSCNCTEGYEGDGVLCTNINECNENPCHANATCNDTDGSYMCHCDDGYISNGKACFNIDECELDNHECHLYANCTDTEGSYNCTCNSGFEGDGFMCVEFRGDSVIISLATGLTVAVLIVAAVASITLIVCVLRHQRHDDQWFLGNKERMQWETELVSVTPPTYRSMTSLVSVFDTLDFGSAKKSMNYKPDILISKSSDPENSHQYMLSEDCSSEHEYAAVDVDESSRSTFCESTQTGTVQLLDHTSQTNSQPNNDIMTEGKQERMSNSYECHQSTHNEESQVFLTKRI